MRGRDKYIFYFIVIVATICGSFIIEKNYSSFSDIITFLSIIIGFEIASLAIIFNSPIKQVLYQRTIKVYRTELHRLRDFYRFSIVINIISVLIVLLIPEFHIEFSFLNHSIEIYKSIFVLPILSSVVYCFLRLLCELLKIFVYPIN